MSGILHHTVIGLQFRLEHLLKLSHHVKRESLWDAQNVLELATARQHLVRVIGWSTEFRHPVTAREFSHSNVCTSTLLASVNQHRWIQHRILTEAGEHSNLLIRPGFHTTQAFRPFLSTSSHWEPCYGCARTNLRGLCKCHSGIKYRQNNGVSG